LTENVADQKDIAKEDTKSPFQIYVTFHEKLCVSYISLFYNSLRKCVNLNYPIYNRSFLSVLFMFENKSDQFNTKSYLLFGAFCNFLAKSGINSRWASQGQSRHPASFNNSRSISIHENP
jgi:hypothetical protein